MSNKRGLSGVVSVLLIILITLVAIGIFWTVAKGVITRSESEIDMGSKCLDSDIRITGLDYVSPNWTISIRRKSGTEEFQGIKFLLHDTSRGESTPTTLEDVSVTNIRLLETDVATISSVGSGISTPGNVDKVDMIVYFQTENGESFCPIRTFDVSDLR